MDRRIKEDTTLEEYLALPLNGAESRYLRAHLYSPDVELYRKHMKTTRVLAWQAAHTPLPDTEEDA